jgi:hypothetical protein
MPRLLEGRFGRAGCCTSRLYGSGRGSAYSIKRFGHHRSRDLFGVNDSRRAPGVLGFLAAERGDPLGAVVWLSSHRRTACLR